MCLRYTEGEEVGYEFKSIYELFFLQCATHFKIRCRVPQQQAWHKAVALLAKHCEFVEFDTKQCHALMKFSIPVMIMLTLCCFTIQPKEKYRKNSFDKCCIFLVEMAHVCAIVIMIRCVECYTVLFSSFSSTLIKKNFTFSSWCSHQFQMFNLQQSFVETIYRNFRYYAINLELYFLNMNVQFV